MCDYLKISNIYIIGIPEREDRVSRAEKRIMTGRYPEFDEKHQLTDPKRSLNIKQDSCKKNYTCAHLNRTSENQR